MNFWVNLETKIGCLDNQMSRSVWQSRLQLKPKLVEGCMSEPSLSYRTHLREAILDAHEALMGTLSIARELSRCYAIGGRSDKTLEFEKLECYRMSEAHLLDGDGGLLTQLAFRAQVFSGYVQALVVDHRLLGLGFMSTFFSNLGVEASHSVGKSINDAVAELALKTFGNSKRMVVCGGILISIAQMADLFRAFGRTIKLFAAQRTQDMWRLPFKMQAGNDMSEVIKPLRQVYSCRHVFNPLEADTGTGMRFPQQMCKDSSGQVASVYAGYGANRMCAAAANGAMWRRKDV